MRKYRHKRIPRGYSKYINKSTKRLKRLKSINSFQCIDIMNGIGNDKYDNDELNILIFTYNTRKQNKLNNHHDRVRAFRNYIHKVVIPRRHRSYKNK